MGLWNEDGHGNKVKHMHEVKNNRHMYCDVKYKLALVLKKPGLLGML